MMAQTTATLQPSATPATFTKTVTACPAWCDGTCAGDRPAEAAAYGIAHMRMYHGRDAVILLRQDDELSPVESGTWIRHPAKISVLRDLRPDECSPRGLSPEQAYAVADLIRDEDLACRILAAVEAAAPALTR